jgi:hypothetical protein
MISLLLDKHLNRGKMRKRFWEKLNGDDRTFMWFYKNYLKDAKLHYNTLYQQAKGDILTNMSDELKKAIEKYLGA